MPDKPIEIFFSYAHEDESLRDGLADHLKIFERQGVSIGWHDRRINAGSEWAKQIDERLNTADLILLLVSKDFLASDYCYDVEMPRAIERHERDEAHVIPIILRPCAWKRAPFRKLQVLPKDALPVIDWPHLDKAFLNVVEEIEIAIEKIKTKAASSMSSPASAQAAGRQPKLTHSRIWNVPHLHNPNFTGREADLKALRDSLFASKTAALVQTRAIHGLGGIGKTQLATEYAYLNGADYDVVWWIRSEDPTTRASDYASLAAKLDLPEKAATEQRVVIEAVKDWLRLHRDWLLIFDNAEDAESVRDYIPRGSAGHIVVTSRSPNWAGVAKPLSVKTLPPREAVKFLLKRTGQPDKATAKTLAAALGCLPLALEQAGAYIEASGSTMRHYLELFETRQRDLLQRGKPSDDYPDTVATTWSLSFQKVEHENPAAAELLRLCAFFAPDDIPIKMLTAGAKHMPESLSATVTDALRFDEALMALRKYSLVAVDNETLAIHRLVQAVIRHTLDETAFKQWTGVAVHVVNASYPFDSNDVRTWPICEPLLPHASAALSHAETVQFASIETARLFNQVGLYLKTRAEYGQAKKMYERALAIGEATLSPDHPNVATWLNNLGNVLQDQGDLAGAKALYERALAIDETALGSDHPNVASRLNNLGNVLQDQGDLAGAKALYERALAIDETALGPDHPDVAIDLNNLGEVLREQSDLAAAKILFERAIAIGEAAFGPDHPQVATFANNLGLVLQAQNELAGAKTLFKRALAINEAAFGLNHPNVAIRLNNLGGVLRAQGDLAGAKPLFERALRIFREFLGDDHPTTKIVQGNLRRVEEELKNAEP
jgi:tetratricopeptide (TPR) repeat protein